MIVKFDLKTPGREPPDVDDEQDDVTAGVPHRAVAAPAAATSIAPAQAKDKDMGAPAT
jgi:hypothetical protein